jgi:DNA-binding CsgD family transcriptional regulator
VERLVPPRRAAAPAAPEGLEAAEFAVGEDQYVVFSLRLPEPVVPPNLTAAEQVVVREVLAGRSNSEIAATRGTSTHTVANQLRSVYTKLGISGRVELVRVCFPGPRS